MSVAISFNTARFDLKGGFLVQNISPTRNSREFQQLLDDLEENPQATFNIGISQPLTGRVLGLILEQLTEPPVVNRVKQIDPEGMKFFLGLASGQDGFRDNFFVDDMGRSQIQGSMRDDVVLGRGGRDNISGRAGDDFLNGGGGNDKLFGNRGADEIFGATGNDLIRGGPGRDSIQGGAGSDDMAGGPGADAYFFGRADFRGAAEDSDIIRNFRPGQGDQIVDKTGELKVVAAGNIAEFGGRGTLLENERTGDKVFVEGAIVRQADINRKFVQPPPGIDSPNDNVRPTGPLDFDVVAIADFEANGDRFDIFQVKARNLTTDTIANISDLVVNFRDAGRVTVDTDRLEGATFANGRFSVNDGQGPLNAGQEAFLFTFQVINLPRNLRIDSNDFRADGFRAVDEEGDSITGGKIGFNLRVRELDNFNGGGSIEVFIRNVGNEAITNLEDARFRFVEPQLKEIVATWGATERPRDQLAIDPWTGNDRPDLNPGDSTKLFGLSYEFSGGRRPDITSDDFKLVTPFDDLFT